MAWKTPGNRRSLDAETAGTHREELTGGVAVADGEGVLPNAWAVNLLRRGFSAREGHLQSQNFQQSKPRFQMPPSEIQQATYSPEPQVCKWPGEGTAYRVAAGWVADNRCN